jgi:hypothetical protein
MRLLGFILAFSFFSITVNGQTEMLIEQISGRIMVRENFNKKGTFLNKQTFNVGDVTKKNGYYSIKIISEFFEQDKKTSKKYTTTYRCKPSEASVMVMVFPLSKPKSKKTEINTISKNFKEIYDLKNLMDIELAISFDAGLLNFVGSKSKIKIYNRKFEEGKNGNEIKSKISVKAYTLGMKIKQLNYVVTENLDEKGLLTFQQFTETDGSYFTVTYK